MERETAVFIINPAAGKRDTSEKTRALAQASLEGSDRPGIIYKTSAPGDGEAFVRKTAAESPEKAFLFIACGGDGTLNEVVNGAAGLQNARVTHFPCGSGNDFIKCLTKNTAAFSDIPALLNGRERVIDLIECAGRYVANICSVGLDARIAALVPKLKRYPLVSGSGAYILALIINLFKRIWEPYLVTVNGEAQNGGYVIVVAANGTHYGGGFNPLPEAVPDDGVLEFLMVKKLSRFIVAKVVNKYKQGRYREIMKYFIRLSGDMLELSAAKPVAVNIDGEIRYEKDIKIRLSENRLRFVVPVTA